MIDVFSHAKWIWSEQSNYNGYNDSIVAIRDIQIEKSVVNASIAISADSFYRLHVNGEWVCDGPAKYWPGYAKYDQMDITSCLVKGVNRISISARYYGTGDFRHLPCESGLIAQLRIAFSDDTSVRVGTDGNWTVSTLNPLCKNTPKTCIQMEPFECYDARREDQLVFKKAKALYGADEGPCKHLSCRETPLLSKDFMAFKNHVSSHTVRSRREIYCVNPDLLLYPGLINANANVSQPFALATSLKNGKEGDFTIYEDSIRTQNLQITVDGKRVEGATFRLSPGTHLVLLMAKELVIHDKDVSFGIEKPEGAELINPINQSGVNPWCFLAFPQYAFVRNDLDWIWLFSNDKNLEKIKKSYQIFRDTIIAEVNTTEKFSAILARYIKSATSMDIFLKDNYVDFKRRTILHGDKPSVIYPEGLISDNFEYTVVTPSEKGDVELCYDLGEQVFGNCRLDLIAPEGVEIDVFGIEFVDEELGVQHTYGCRNGFTYITKSGVNKYTSFKRISGRYLFITLRNFHSELKIRNICMIASTYPMDKVGDFSCDDPTLNAVWDICVRTLKLCMDDTFIDCPVYEQAYWVGDGRNEALYAMGLLGKSEIVKRGLTLAAESLDRYPLAVSHAPTSWDMIIPSFGFLWIKAVWEYYFFTEDLPFLNENGDRVYKSLEYAMSLKDANGLFKSSYWNMCDWTGQDDVHKVVLYNSMFLYGAMGAALNIFSVLGDKKRIEWVEQRRAELKHAVNRQWNEDKAGYPDSIHAEGAASDSYSQHTLFLGLLYEVISENHVAGTIQSLMSPSDNKVRVGSPFASMFLYECYDKYGFKEHIVEAILRDYSGMLEKGATTVWESYATSHIGRDGFPTRSHCHAFSCAPLYFLPRVVLGICQVSAGGKRFSVSPRPCRLKHAKGRYATPLGPIDIRWEIDADNFVIDIKKPDAVVVDFVLNDALEKYQVVLNGNFLQALVDNTSGVRMVSESH